MSKKKNPTPPDTTSTHEEGASDRSTTLDRAIASLNQGDLAGAEALCIELLTAYGEDADAGRLLADVRHMRHVQAAQACFPGIVYHDWLRWFHATLRPATYLEIGVESGASLCFAQAPTRAVGVDPDIRVVHGQETWCKLFKLTSDDFFARNDLRQVFGAETLDLAFIDGLHTFDQALKDFMNIERYARPDTVVLFHDIWPVEPITAARERVTSFWPGDTWKAMLILRELRPDLHIFTIPTYPSGLGVVTRLDSSSDLLWREFNGAVADWLPVKIEGYLDAMAQHLNATANDFVSVSRHLSAR